MLSLLFSSSSPFPLSIHSSPQFVLSPWLSLSPGLRRVLMCVVIQIVLLWEMGSTSIQIYMVGNLLTEYQRPGHALELMCKNRFKSKLTTPSEKKISNVFLLGGNFIRILFVDNRFLWGNFSKIGNCFGSVAYAVRLNQIDVASSCKKSLQD